jgi:hypothetical protein
VYDTYAGPAGVCYLDFVWHWMWTALRSDPDAAYQHARTLAHHLIPLCAIVADAEPSR